MVLFVPKRQMVVSFNTKYNNNSNTEGKNDLKLKTSSTGLFESKFLYNPFLQEIKKKLTEIKAPLPPKKHWSERSCCTVTKAKSWIRLLGKRLNRYSILYTTTTIDLSSIGKNILFRGNERGSARVGWLAGVYRT